MLSAIARRSTRGILAQGVARAVIAASATSPNALTVGPNIALRQGRSMADAAAAEAPSTKSRRRSLLDDSDTKDPIILTERAAKRIHELLANHRANAAGNEPEPKGIRLGVKRRGCNGLSYTLNYVFDPQKEAKKDITMESHGVHVWIEPMALFNIVGTTMDWEETELSSEFTFTNPQERGKCGCGQSFTV